MKRHSQKTPSLLRAKKSGNRYGKMPRLEKGRVTRPNAQPPAQLPPSDSAAVPPDVVTRS